ncbi:MAG: hypothetical protein WBD24_05155 [Candidatus Omnitrophota bacterium]
MKKGIAILLVFFFALGCVAAFAEVAMDANKLQEQNKTKTGEKRLEAKFWDDLVSLFTEKIPGTVDQKSSKHPYESATK